MVTEGPPVLTDSMTSGYRVPCTRKRASSPSRFAVSSKIRMKVLPMAFRFASGSTIPSTASRNSRRASTTTSRMPMCLRKVRSTLSRSFFRRSPLSTKMQVRRSPTARWTSAAATDESTPPESPQMTCSSPACSAIRATA